MTAAYARKDKEAIIKIYEIAKRIAPVNESGTNSANKHWKEIYQMAHLARAIDSDLANLQWAEYRVDRLEEVIKELNKELELAKKENLGLRVG